MKKKSVNNWLQAIRDQQEQASRSREYEEADNGNWGSTMSEESEKKLTEEENSVDILR